MSIKQIIFQGTVVFVLRRRSGVAGQEASVSAEDVADGSCDMGPDAETIAFEAWMHSMLQAGVCGSTFQPPPGSGTVGLWVG